MISEVVFLVILIAVNAFFAASEMALISLNDNKIKLMAEEGHKKAKKLVKLLSEPSRFLATIQIGITLAGFLASAFAAESFSDPLVKYLNQFDLPVSEAFLKTSTVVLITLILSYFTLVLGELVPKRVAMNMAEPIAFTVVPVLIILSKLTNPFVKLLTFSTNFFVRLFGIDPHSIDDDVTEEEIRMMVDVGEEKGAIDEREKIMINNIFEFNNKSAEDIMTHRMEVIAISTHIDLSKLMTLVKTEQYSRIPVYEESIDNIIGILYVKDLLKLIGEDTQAPFIIQEYIRKPYFVPKQKKIDELFIELQTAKTHIAIVLDEYGGTAGIVTIEDLIEEIVGNIFDEYDEDEDRELIQIDADTYEVSGMIGLDELAEVFEIDLPTNEYDTLNGFLISLYGNLPPKEEITEIKFAHILFQVVQLTDKRIEKVVVKLENNINKSDIEEEI